MRYSIRRMVFVLSYLMFILGCSFYHIKSQEMSLEYYPPKSSKDEVLYLEQVDRPFQVIGSVTVNTERNKKFEDILDKMKQEAAILGGDAITDLTSDGGTGIWAKVKPKNLFGNSNIRTNFNAKVIVFVGEGPS